MKRKENIKYYDTFAGWYENERHKRYHSFLDTSEVALAQPFCENQSVLEVGAGTGLVMKRLEEFSREVTGIDISLGMVRKAHERNLDVAQASATALPFPDKTFDCVVSFKVLAHIEAIRETLAECARVTRPGGHMVLEFYNKHSIRSLVKALKPAHNVASDTTDDQVYTRFDSLEDIRSYLPADCRVKEVAGIRCLAPTYHFYNAPYLGAVTERIERAVQRTPLGRIGGFLVVVIERT